MSILSLFCWPFCYHSNSKSKINARILHLGYSSNILVKSKFQFLAPEGGKEALAIRRVFSLVDMITNAKFTNSPMNLEFVCLGSIICIVSIKIRFKAIHHLQSLENLHFLLPPLSLRIYTGCRLDQNFSKSIIGFQKSKRTKLLRI